MSKIEAIAAAAGGKTSQSDVGEVVVDGALKVAQTGIPMAGPIGYVAGVPFSFLVANRDAQKKLLDLSEHPVIRSQVAVQLGIPEVAVNPQMLLIAAQQNEALQQAVQAIDDKRSSHVWENGAGIAGMATAVGAVAALSTGPVGLIAGGLAALAGGFLGEGIGAKVFGADGNLNPMTHLDRIKELRAIGAPFAEVAGTIFALRVSQNPALQEGIEHAMGKPYFSLSDEEKQTVMSQSKGLADGCLYDAQMLLQYPQAEPEYLMFGNMPSPQQQMQPPAPVVVEEFANAGVTEMKKDPESEIVVGPHTARLAQERGGRTVGRPASMAQMIDQQRAAAVGSQTLPQ